MVECRAPQNKEELKEYFNLRWQLLRKPLHQPQGSEKDELESQSIHRAIFKNAKVCGIGRLHKVSHDVAQIRYMGVDDTYQKQGYGKQLLKALEQQARFLGVKEITLNARKQAIEFYQQLGYTLLGYSHTLFDTIEHFTMSKTLPILLEHKKNESASLVDIWHNTIPMSKAMGINICYYDGQILNTTCDPTFNKNLHNTMFAGSIYTLATLTGWGWIYLALEQLNLSGSIVLADGQIKYLKPIDGYSHGHVNHPIIKDDFGDLDVKGKMSMTLAVNIYCGDMLAASFTGYYVVKVHKKEK